MQQHVTTISITIWKDGKRECVSARRNKYGSYDTVLWSKGSWDL